MNRLTRHILQVAAALCCFISLQARRGVLEPVAAPEPAAVAPVSTNTPVAAGQYHEVDMLLERAQRDAQEVQRQAAREVHEFQGRVKRRQSRAERRRQEQLRREAEERALREQAARDRTEQMKRQADADAAKILKEAQVRAARLRESLKEQDLQDRIQSRPKVNEEWRRGILRDFENDSFFMNRVIMEGEASSVERDNFRALFAKQKQWFEHELKKAVYFFDDAYNVVITKKNALSGLVDAQRQADEIIFDLVDQHHLSDAVRKQLRLLAMYEINNHLQTHKTSKIYLPADTIRKLVMRISKDLTPGLREIKIVSEKERIGSLEERIAELELQLEQQVQQAAASAQLDIHLAQGAEAYDQAQEAVVQGKKDRIALLEREKEEAVSAVRTEVDDTIRRLQKEKRLAEGERTIAIEEESARAKERIDNVIAQKDAEIAEAKAVAEKRVAEMTRKQKELRESFYAEKEQALEAIRKQLSELKKEKKNAVQQLRDHEVALSAERSKAQSLASQLGTVRKQVSGLESQVKELHKEKENMSAEHKIEREAMIARIHAKQEQRNRLQLKYEHTSKQLKLLASEASEQILAMASQIAEQEVSKEALENVMVRKAEEQAELEMDIATVGGQLRGLARDSQGILVSFSQQLLKAEARCAALNDELARKEQEAGVLENLLDRMSEKADANRKRAHQMEDAIAVAIKEKSDLHERVIQLQHALDGLRHEQENGLIPHPAAARRMRSLADRTSHEVGNFAQVLHQQNNHLRQRRHSYDRMRTLQNKIHNYRAGRADDPVRDARHTEVLDQMADFGKQVVKEHDTVKQAVVNTQSVSDRLDDFNKRLDAMDTIGEGDFAALDEMLSVLGKTSSDTGTIPEVASLETLSAPQKEQPRVVQHHEEDEEDEEHPHEPDDHPELPEPVADDDIADDATPDDFVLDAFNDDDITEDDLFGDDASDDPFENETTPEELVAVMPGSTSEQDDEEEDEYDDGFEGGDSGEYDV